MILQPTEEEKKKKLQAGGSAFTDVSKYLAANKPQAARFASDVGNKVLSTGNQARTALGTAQSKFNTQLSGNRVPYDQNLANRAATDPRSFYSYPSIQYPEPKQKGQAKNRAQQGQNGPQKNRFSGLVSYLSQGRPAPAPSPTEPATIPAGQPATEPAGPQAVNPADVAAFQRMAEGNYAGPTDLTGIEGFDAATDQANKAAVMTDQLSSDAGRADLLGSIYGQPSNTLDEMLLKGGDAQGILGQAKTENAGIGDVVENANTTASDEALKAQNEAAATKQEIAKRFLGEGGVIPGVQEDLASVSKKKGGSPFKKSERAAQTQNYEQMLDALTRLMGTGSNA